MAEEEQRPITLKDMLLDHFAPAHAGDTKRSWKTTTDLFNILDEHAPGQFDVTQLFPILRAAGFVDKLMGDAIMWDVAERG